MPASPRDSARLLEISSKITDYTISDLPDLLRAGDILVLNNTKVIPAKLIGKRGDATISVNLHKEVQPGKWKAFAKPAKRLRLHDRFIVADDFFADVVDKGEDGEVTLHFNAFGADFFQQLSHYGQMPLPPYIKRTGEVKEDHSDYQTIFAQHEGAVAAPTAGLHFTEGLLNRLQEKGIQFAYVTLHVGAGTFLPVKVEHIADHKMHAEWCEMSAQTAQQINGAKARGGRIVAVGTTSLRVLESVAGEDGTMKAFSGDTSIFITPGYRFKAVDILMTNFHLPCSTLLMLVCAFASRERIFQAYRHAIDSDYRFYSYGDATLIHRAL